MNLFPTSSSFTPGKGLDNPAFRIKIIDPNDDLQQKQVPGRPNPSDDALDNIAVGDSVNWRMHGRRMQGTVQRIIKNEEGDGTFVIAKSDDGRSYKVEATRLIFSDQPNAANDDEYALTSAPALYHESLLSFEEFSKRLIL